TLWTRAAVAAWAGRELGVVRSIWAWGRWLRAHHFTSRKAACRAYERDEAAVQRWLNTECPQVEEQASKEGAEIHWLDEAGLRSDCSVGRGYSPVGRPPVLRVPGRRFGGNYVATVNSAGLLRFLVYVGKLTGAILTTFLGRLLANRSGKVYVVRGNHPTHRGREVARWVGEQEGRIRLVYLPSYSPELNPAEYLNNDVKANAQRKQRARDEHTLLKVVRSYLFSVKYREEYVRAYFRAGPVRY